MVHHVDRLVSDQRWIHRSRFLAAGFGALALAGAVGLAARGSDTAGFWLHHSAATFTATALAAAVGLLGILSAFAPARRWLAVRRFAEELRRPRPPARYTRSQLGFIGAAVVCHVVCGVFLARANAVPRDDQADYLLVALKATEFHDGPVWMWAALYGGEFREDNRHPLYVALLAVNRTFVFGKLLSLAFGSATVWLLGFSVAQRFGGSAGALAAWLLALNAAWWEASSLVACETLLTLLVFVAWLRLADGRVSPPWDAAAGGAWFALAYLTKASAAFLFFIWIVGLWLQPSRRNLAIGVLAIGAFVAVASPLLTRNLRVFGNPLHSFNNKLLFAESYEAGVAEPDLGTLGNWRRFRSRHSWNEIVGERLLGGVAWEGFVLLRALGLGPLGSGRAVLGAAILALACVGWWSHAGRRLAPAFTMSSLVWFVVFFGWYQPIASGDRFLLPLAPPLLAAAAVGAIALRRTTAAK
jgi:hypothetical protein